MGDPTTITGDISQWLTQYSTEGLSIGTTIFFALLVFLGGHLATGVILGILTAISVFYLVYRSKDGCPRVYNWILDHPFAAVVIMTIGLTGLFGTSVTGLIAGGTFGTVKIAGLSMANKYLDRADVTGVPSVMDSIKDKIANWNKKSKHKDIIDITSTEVQSGTS